MMHRFWDALNEVAVLIGSNLAYGHSNLSEVAPGAVSGEHGGGPVAVNLVFQNWVQVAAS